MQPREIRELTIEEIDQKIDEAHQELFNLRFQLSTGRIENVMRIRHTKRDIARVKTVLRQNALASRS